VSLCRRLGWLNVVNPDYPDNYYELRLPIPDEREAANALTVLAVAEPGENFLSEKYYHPEEVMGWELPMGWFTNGVPSDGRTCFEYTSKGYRCAADWNARALLRRHFLVFNCWTDWDGNTGASAYTEDGGLRACDARSKHVGSDGSYLRSKLDSESFSG